MRRFYAASGCRPQAGQEELALSLSGTSGTRNQIVLFPERWHPDDASSPLARTQVSAWSGQVPVPLFSEKGTGRPEPMTQWDRCAASLTSPNVPPQPELDPAFRAPRPGGLLGDRPSGPTPGGLQDGIVPLPPASGLECCFPYKKFSISLKTPWEEIPRCHFEVSSDAYLIIQEVEEVSLHVQATRPLLRESRLPHSQGVRHV